jgi:hypothetical protein
VDKSHEDRVRMFDVENVIKHKEQLPSGQKRCKPVTHRGEVVCTRLASKSGQDSSQRRSEPFIDAIF